MALLHLMHVMCALHGTKLRAVTLNHGLRIEAAEEARMVGAYCARLGVQHDTLLWDDWDGKGNLQNAARNARYTRMAEWAKVRGINTITLGHTANDQAETVLMRLARRSGVNGLAGIPERILREGITWVRPLLRASREDLRVYLRSQQIVWMEDPSNEDMNYERIKARHALTQLADLGIDAAGLSIVAAQLAKVRAALDWETFIAARDIACIDAGAVVICERRMRILPEEIQRRLLVHAVNWISGQVYPARRAAVTNMLQGLRRGQAGTADGVHARRVGGQIWIFRELNAVREEQSKPGDLWDKRWRFSSPDPGNDCQDLRVRVLGKEGLAQCPEWRVSGRPHAVLLSTPAVWRGDTVVAAPLAGRSQKWHAEVDGGKETFFTSLLTH